VQSGKQPTFKLQGANTQTATLLPTLSGDYTVTLTVTNGAGQQSCTFVVHVGAPGVRVDLCWDTAGDADLDLHLHKPGNNTSWFSATGSSNNINTDDCYYLDCKADATTPVNWGYAYSPLSACQGDPSGTLWSSQGACRNPRMDIDSVSTVAPESTGVDDPSDSQTFRVMVHYFGIGTGASKLTTHPLVNVYCGGQRRASYGASPDVVPNFDHGDGWNQGLMWRVADVRAHVAGGFTTCDVQALHTPGQVSGYYVTNNDSSY